MKFAVIKPFWVTVLLSLLTGSVFAQTAKSYLEDDRVVLISDFDRTLTGPAWNSIWVLKKVPTVNNYFQTRTQTPRGLVTFDELPAEIPLTEHEYIELFKNRLAVSERSGQYTIGSRDSVTLPSKPFPGREQPILFLPGYYMVSPDSFMYYRSNPGNNFLLTDNAIAREADRFKLSRFGITFPLFQTLTSTLKGVENIHIPTARGQSSEEFVEGLFAEWQSEGFIKFIYGEEFVSRDGPSQEKIHVYPLGRGESVLFGDHLTEKKLRLVRDELITHYRMKAMQAKKKYLLVFADDNPEIVQEYHRMLLEYSAISNFRDTLDFMLVHAGTDLEIQRSEMPDRYTIYQAGIARRAPDDFIRTLFPSQRPRKISEISESRKLRICKNLFMKDL
jgi:hypothetical protein